VKKKFNFRGFVSLFVVILFLLISVSGIILYVAPSGRIANEAGWSVLGLNKFDWQSVHTIFTFIFVITIGFHLFYNWRPLLIYFRKKIESHFRLRYEFFGATALTVVLFFLLFNGAPPFSTIMELRDNFKHASAESNTAVGDSVVIAAADSCASGKSESCSKEKEETEVSCSKAADAAKRTNKSNTGEGMGLGRKTIAQLFADLHLSGKDGFDRLASKGIKAENGEKVKEVAEKYNMRPTDINTILSSK
jgi:hypothetical protein